MSGHNDFLATNMDCGFSDLACRHQGRWSNQRIDPTKNVEHLLTQQRPKALRLQILRRLHTGSEHEPRPHISAVVLATGFQCLKALR